MILEGIYRRFQALRAGKGPIDLRLTHAESLAICQVEPIGFEMARAGRRFALGYSAAVTGIAPVQALPTTAAQWVWWNNDATKSHIVQTLGAQVLSGTPGVGGQLFAALIQAPATVGTVSKAGLTVASKSNGGLTSKAVFTSGVTVTAPAAPAWFSVAENLSPNVGAFPGSGIMVNRILDGRIVIPPGQGLALAVVALAGTTPLFGPIAEWVELETDLE
jgi:hypothetical protein